MESCAKDFEDLLELEFIQQEEVFGDVLEVEPTLRVESEHDSSNLMIVHFNFWDALEE